MSGFPIDSVMRALLCDMSLEQLRAQLTAYEKRLELNARPRWIRDAWKRTCSVLAAEIQRREKA